MPRRVKEEEKIEMIIRGLLKQPDNRRCINCNSLGPQYVCSTFWTFVCTNCSGVHREFTHRVKSVSMAKFNDEEIMSLQAGGNERAKQIYFKNWDPQHNSYPDSSNLHRLRQFVSNVYVDRKYAGENSSNKQPLAKSESKNAFCEWPSERSSRWGRRDDFLGRSVVERGSSNSGSDDFCYDRSLFEKSSSSKGGKGLNLKDFLEERSPRNNQEMPRSSSHRSRPTRFEIVDDRFREDGSVRRYERNPVRETGSLKSAASLPVIRPVNVILGDKAPELRVGEPPAADDEASARGQKAADVDADAKERENEATNSTSLIDFLDAKSEADSTVQETPQAEQVASDTNNESFTTETKANAIVPIINSVEYLLFELLPPPTTSSSSDSTLQMSPAAAAPAQPNCTSASSAETAEAPGISNTCGEALAITVMTSNQPLHRDDTNHAVQDIQTHQLPPNTTTLQSTSSVESSLNEQGNRSPASDDLRLMKSVPVVQSSEAAFPSPSARKEIPEDLFSSGFASFTPPVAARHNMHLPHGVGYSMHFHPHAMSLAAYPNSSKLKNPFDIDDDRFQVQAATFPSMSPLQGALPNMPTSAAPQPQPSPYAAALSSHSHISSYGMNMPLVPGAYMAQQSKSMLLTRPEGNANFGRSEDAFASLNLITRGNGAHSLPAAPTSSSSFPRAGNPFG